MNDYSVSDYSIFDDAISNVNTFVDQISSVKDIISECKSELNESIFMGPISDSCREALENLSVDFENIIGDFSKISEYLNNTNSNYQQGDNNASNVVIDSKSTNTGSSNVVSYSANGNNNMSTNNSGVTNYNVSNSDVDISKYSNNSSSGFNVTTGNTTYSLDSSDVDLLYSIVSAESDKSYDDALAVATTILNRCEAPNWIACNGTNPISQATAPNQFVVYQSGSYKAYINGNSPATVQQAVNDALNGVRNHDYLSFRSNGSTGYSNNMITSTGNRYK